MNCSPSRPSDPSALRRALDARMSATGATRWGVARAGRVSPEEEARYSRWLADGHHAAMAYMERHADVRSDPRLLLPEAKSLIVCAFAYNAAVTPAPLRIARYALADDYHERLRQALAPAVQWLAEEHGAQSRVCVDTAPLRERYWAVQAGVGFIGLNNCLIVPGMGSFVLLATIVTTAEIEPDRPCTLTCGSCGLCVKACPGRALHPDGSAADARRCVSYLTIEHRGDDLPAGTRLGCSLYGCDICQEVCPHNARALRSAPAVQSLGPVRTALLALTPAEVSAMTQERYLELTRHSAIRRAKLPQLLRNLRYIGTS